MRLKMFRKNYSDIERNNGTKIHVSRREEIRQRKLDKKRGLLR